MAEKKRTSKKVTHKTTPQRGRRKAVLPEAPSERTQKKESRSFLPEFLRFGESYISLGLGIIVVIAVAALLVSFARNGFQHRPQKDTSSTSTQVSEQANTAQPGSVYTIQEGDDLWKIAEKAYSDGNQWQIIAEANNISDPGQISVGTKLSIPETEKPVHLAVSMTPAPTATATPTLTATKAPTATAVPTLKSAVTLATTPTTLPTPKLSPTVALTATPTVISTPKPTVVTNQQPTGPPQTVAGKSYKVVAGDTLWDIAVRTYGNGYRWVDIARANNLSNPDLIYPGNNFQLPK